MIMQSIAEDEENAPTQYDLGCGSPSAASVTKPPNRYSISPGAYSPFAMGAGDQRRTSQLYSPFRASPVRAPGIASEAKGSNPILGALDKRKRFLSSWSSGLLSKASTTWTAFHSASAGAATAAASADAPSDALSEAEASHASPLKRSRTTLDEPANAPASSGGARPPKFASKLSAGLKEVASAAAKLPPPTKLFREASRGVERASSSLQAAAKSALQAVDDEADAVFDNVEAAAEAISHKVKKAVAAVPLPTMSRRPSKDQTAEGPTSVADEDGEQREGCEKCEEGRGRATAPVDEEVADPAAAAAEAALHGLVDSVVAMGGKVEERLVAAEENLLAVGGEISEAVSEGLEGAVQGVHGAMAQGGEAVAQVQQRVATMQASVHASVEQVVMDVASVEASLDEAVDKAVESVVDLFANRSGAMSSTLSQSFPEMRESVQDLEASFAGVVNGVKQTVFKNDTVYEDEAEVIVVAKAAPLEDAKGKYD